MMDSLRLVPNVSLKTLTTFKIGGNATYLAECQSAEAVREAYRFASEQALPVVLMGRGSNVLASDKGFNGVVVVLKGALEEVALLSELSVNEKFVLVRVGAGKGLIGFAQMALANEWAGFEFASGIPGTFGGALYMNAGAYEHSISELVQSVEAYDILNDRMVTLANEECAFGYRSSRFQKGDLLALSVTLALPKGNKEQISALMHEFSEKRRSKQPLEFPSAGSTFKRPEGHFAGALIEAAGLKGTRVGGAVVSPKHAGFVVSDSPNTTARDVIGLMDQVRQSVLAQSGVLLEPEVKFLGPNGFVETGFEDWMK